MRQPTKKTTNLAKISAFVGATLEFYDFLLFGTAASLVFPALFFSEVSPQVGAILSYVALATGYIARPIGGILFGHFGDRVGRKRMLIITMFIMGFTSIGVGLLPTEASIGVAAPVLLTALRVLQGIAVGGEFAGAALLSMEHSKPKGRGFGAAVAVAGGPTGAVLATLVFGAFATMPEPQFMSWGWRVPFLLSAVLLIVGIILRLKVTESPDFERAEEIAEHEPSVPLVRVIMNYPKQILGSVVGSFAPLFMQSLLATFALRYAAEVGHSQSSALLTLTIANAVHIFTIPAAAALSDRLGRRNVMVAGTVIGILGIWPMFALISHGSTALMLLGFMLGNPVIQAVMYGPLGAWIGEMFPTKMRYTGMSLSYQIGTTLGAGFAPLIATALVGVDGGSTHILSVFFCGLCVISGVAMWVTHPTHGEDLDKVYDLEAHLEGN